MAIGRIRLRRLFKFPPLRIFLITSSLLCIYFLGISTRPYKHETHRRQEFEGKDFSSYKNFARHLETARRNLIIMSHGRSGSSLMGDIFNHHPTVFYMYEPLQTTKRVTKGQSGERSYSSLVEQYLTGVFRCRFDQPEILADIEKYYRKSDHPRVSQAIASPPLCPYTPTDPRWDSKLCYPMTGESLGSACKDNYDLTVVKVLMDRIPEQSIKTFLTICNPLDVDCKVVFLVRDPRAVIASSRSIGFFSEKGKPPNSLIGTRIFSYWHCKQTEDNLELIRKLPNLLRERIKLQRYEDLAVNPLKELSGLYEFAGLPVLESVRTWLNETTQMSRDDCTKIDGEQATCTKDNARVATNRWRWKVHPHEIDIIEYYCSGVMRLLGYRPVDRSYELLTNVTIPLFSQDFEAKSWVLH